MSFLTETQGQTLLPHRTTRKVINYALLAINRWNIVGAVGIQSVGSRVVIQNGHNYLHLRARCNQLLGDHIISRAGKDTEMNKGDFITACSNIFMQYSGVDRFDQLSELWDELTRQNERSADQQLTTNASGH